MALNALLYHVKKPMPDFFPLIGLEKWTQNQESRRRSGCEVTITNFRPLKELAETHPTVDHKEGRTSFEAWMCEGYHEVLLFQVRSSREVKRHFFNSLGCKMMTHNEFVDSISFV